MCYCEALIAKCHKLLYNILINAAGGGFLAIYFDNSATTKPCDEAVEAAKKAMSDFYGNPSSLHSLGIKAHDELELARRKTARALSCRTGGLYFAPSGTAANNAAIFGVFERLRKEGNTVVTTGFEHPSVQEPVKKLKERFGANVIYLSCDKNGAIDKDELYGAIGSDTILVSMMAVNNETGAVLPVCEIQRAVKRAKSPAVIHSDCIQAFGKIKISPELLGADLLSVSSHKIHGPKGAGALYIGDKNKIKPQTLGGGQEGGIFSGTEPTPAIMGFAAAADALPDIDAHYAHIARLKERLLAQLKDCDKITVNSPKGSVPHIVSLSVLTMKSQPTVNYLSDKGICVSAGSACKKGQRSLTLAAMGLLPIVIDSAVRISFSRYNSEREVDILASELLDLAKRI